MAEENKFVLPKPFGYLLLAFGLEIILMLIVFLSNGLNYFENDSAKIGILLPLGFLTFISIFFGIEYIRPLNDFSKLIEMIENKFDKELKGLTKKITTKNLRDKELKDFQERYNNLKELKRYTNPLLWMFLSVFSCILAILMNFIIFSVKIPFTIITLYNYNLISFFIHIGILSGLFLITSYLVLKISSYYVDRRIKIK